MLKMIKAILLATVISIGLVGCTVADLAQEPTNLEVDEPEVVEVVEEIATIPSSVYENEDCGFVLSFPERWGGVDEEVIPSEGSTALNIVLTSKKDPTLTMTILAVRGDHSRYTTPIGGTDECVLYVDEAKEDMELQKITNTFAVVDGDLAEYSNEKADFSFKYPKTMHLNVATYYDENPAVYVSFGDEANLQGYIMDRFSFAVYNANYNEWMENNAEGPWVKKGNACEEDLPGFKTVFGCEDISMGKNSYFAVTNLGDIGMSKYYHYEKEGAEYPSLVLRVDMYTEDYDTGQDFNEFTTQFKSGELTPQQLKRIELADSILETLIF
jgi:hypothetical protein